MTASHSLKLGDALMQMNGTFKVDGSGKVDFQEEDGIDYAAVTVQLPGGERVPFLFTVKELNAKGTLDGFGGDFTVPSYRGSSFLDPKVCTKSVHTCGFAVRSYIHDCVRELLVGVHGGHLAHACTVCICMRALKHQECLSTTCNVK